MPLTPELRKFLRDLFQFLELQPIEHTDPRYVPLYESLEDGDPVERLSRTINFSETQSCQFFSGFRGTGKSTQLLRLKSQLEAEGYLAFYANAMDYLNPALPIEIGDLLVLLAGAFSDAVFESEGINLAGQSYWERFRNFLTTTQVELTDVELGLVKDVAKLKLAFRDTPSFRDKLQQALSVRLFEVELQVRKFFEDYVKELRERHLGNAGIVFIFDNLEQLRGSATTEAEVIAGVQRLFTVHIDRLKIPYIHMVYTVPPWLKFLLAGVDVELLPSICQWTKHPDRTPKAAGHASMLDVIRKRFGEEGFTRFFGDDSKAGEFVKVCGGNLRDLIRLLQEAFRRVDLLPITDKVIQSCIRSIRDDLLPIPTDDATWLSRIARLREPSLPNGHPDTISRFALFLDVHLVLLFRNGDDWYDVHPLIREYVEQLAVTEQGHAIDGQGSSS
jgi:hypothetical protein